jgi:plastocyanin
MNHGFRASLCLLWASALGAAATPTGRVEGRVALVDNGRPRSNSAEVVVWIEATRREAIPGSRNPGREKAPAPPSMTSSHKKFVPRVVAVSSGEAVSFPNEDPIFHNVFSVSGENRFDLGLYRRGKSKDRVFSAPGLVRVYCNIHPQMVGYVRVVDSDFFAVTRADGAFFFDGVPAGERKVRAWCEEGGETSAAASVRAGRPAEISLTLEVGAFKPESHKNKYGKDYPPPPPDEDRY